MQLSPLFSWQMAEELALAHMKSIGYTDARRMRDGPDGGIDVTSAMAVAQVKYRTAPVPIGEVQRLRGIVHDGRQALFYSFSGYTATAVRWADAAGIALYTYTAMNQVTPLNQHAFALDGTAGSHEEDVLKVRKLVEAIREMLNRTDPQVRAELASKYPTVPFILTPIPEEDREEGDPAEWEDSAVYDRLQSMLKYAAAWRAELLQLDSTFTDQSVDLQAVYDELREDLEHYFDITYMMFDMDVNAQDNFPLDLSALWYSGPGWVVEPALEKEGLPPPDRCRRQ